MGVLTLFVVLISGWKLAEFVTANRFDRIHFGQTETEVAKIMGSPEHVENLPTGVRWNYATPSATWIVTFDHDNRVIKTDRVAMRFGK